jgi:hypothetical protein
MEEGGYERESRKNGKKKCSRNCVLIVMHENGVLTRMSLTVLW